MPTWLWTRGSAGGSGGSALSSLRSVVGRDLGSAKKPALPTEIPSAPNGRRGPDPEAGRKFRVFPQLGLRKPLWGEAGSRSGVFSVGTEAKQPPQPRGSGVRRCPRAAAEPGGERSPRRNFSGRRCSVLPAHVADLDFKTQNLIFLLFVAVFPHPVPLSPRSAWCLALRPRQDGALHARHGLRSHSEKTDRKAQRAQSEVR